MLSTKTKLLSKFAKVKKTILTIFLASNLTLIATGSATLESFGDLDILDGQTSPSAIQESSGSAVSPSPTPSPLGQLGQSTIGENRPLRTFKIDPTGSFIEDELVVKFKKNFPQTEKEGILSSHQASILWEGRSEATLVKVDPSQRDRLLKMLSANPNVEYVHENTVGYVQEGGDGDSGCVPNDYYYCTGDYQWGLRRTRADAAWLYNRGSASTKIAVIDSGVDYEHYDLGLSSSGGKVIKGYDFVGHDNDPMDNFTDIGHGTGVAGIAAALTNNTSAIAGVNWHAKILAIRATNNIGVGTAYDAAEGIFYAVDHNVHVINLSLSFPDDNPELRNAVDVALDSGMIVVASVHGGTTKNCFMGFPAAYSGVISVAATNKNDNWISGCTGRTKNGVNYQKLQITAPGKDIFTLARGSGIGYRNGTSFAAPFVSGAASILVNCTASTNVKNDLIGGADDAGSSGWDSTFGYGILNIQEALRRAQLRGDC